MEPPEHSPDIIDVADGIDRVMGDRRLYARMLVRFRRDYSGGAGAILTALERGDLREAQRLAHSLKGASGMIGAVALHLGATAAEQAIRTVQPRMRELTEALEPEFQKVYKLLDVLIATMATQDTAPPAAAREPAPLARLADLLRNGDGAALDLAERHAAGLGAILGEAAFKQFQDAVNNFDYPRALAILTGPTGTE